MALDFAFQLETPESVREVAVELHTVASELGLLPPELTARDLSGGGGGLGSIGWVQVGTCSADRGAGDPVTEELGFTPTVDVSFRLTKDAASPQQDQIVGLVAGLLRRVPGDAVLHYLGEHLWLVRRDGELVVNERPDFWSPERLAMLPTPFRRAHVPFVIEPCPDGGRYGAVLRLEVRRHHELLARWLAKGHRPALAEFLAAHDPRFRLVSTDGTVLTLADLRTSLATAGGGSPGLRILVGQVEIVADHGGLGVVRYLERHHRPALGGGTRTRRWVTAALRADSELPHGYRWLHVHETATESA